MYVAYENDAERAVAPSSPRRYAMIVFLRTSQTISTINEEKPNVHKIALRHVMLAATVMAFAGTSSPGLAHDQAVFRVTIANVATDATLRLPDGRTTAAPIAPGMYAIVGGGARLFSEGEPVGDSGLEHLAEDGNFEPLLEYVKALPGVRQAGMFIPGQAFEAQALPGDRLVFGTMFVQSNDLFFAADPAGLPLFDRSKRPLAGDRTAETHLWDAGTEINEPPGAGPNQAPRQSRPNTGPAEGGVAHAVDDDFTYPAVDEVINLTIAAE